ncbi:hypothetical protein LTR95_001764 [Oleoguttula sp. CCFEE 5521]
MAVIEAAADCIVMVAIWLAQPSSLDRSLELPELEKGCATSLSLIEARTIRRREHKAPLTSTAWMALLKDETPLSALTIPGTHDSAAYTYKVPFVTTQTMDFKGQLDAGIRYFDLRCGLRNDIVEMVHGTAILGLRLEDVLMTMYLWLLSHPTEALIAQIKRDRQEENSTISFAQAIISLISSKPEHWRTANTTPTLGEARGRIQLFRRFTGPSLWAFGIDVSRWQDNPEIPFTIRNWNGVQLTIQDHYSFPDPESLPSLITKKGGDISNLLEKAAGDADPQHWYINFTSGFEFNLYYQIPPKKLALGGWWVFRWEDGINKRLGGYLSTRGRRRLGIIAMDFPEAGADDLPLTVLKMNFGQQTAPAWKSWALGLCAIILMLMSLAMYSLAWDWPSGYWRLFRVDLCAWSPAGLEPLECAWRSY